MAIKNVVFDLGGVIIDLNRERSVQRFEELGVKDADQLIDPYEQKGIFLQVENGSLDEKGFRKALGLHAGREFTYEEVAYGWMGFVTGVPAYKLEFLLDLRKKYQVYILSNTNPYIMDGWARTKDFTEDGLSLSDYCEKIYASFEIGITKPDPRIFEIMMQDSGMIPGETLFVDDGKRNVDIAASMGFHTYQPANMEDWREPICQILGE